VRRGRRFSARRRGGEADPRSRSTGEAQHLRAPGTASAAERPHDVRPVANGPGGRLTGTAARPGPGGARGGGSGRSGAGSRPASTLPWLLAVAAVVLASPSALGAGSRAAARAAATHPQIRVGGFPTGIALDPVTGTIYVGNGTANTVSLIDGKTCYAGDAVGCGQNVAAVSAGADPIGVAVDATTHTVYVVSFLSGAVAVVDGRRCDPATASGCRVERATVRVGPGPQFLAVDQRTDTIYVADSSADTVSVIDGRTCNASSTAGCGRLRASIPVGPGPLAVAMNDVTNTLYVTLPGADAVSVIDGKTCDATNISGCRRPPVTVEVGQTPGGIAVDTRTDTIYVTGESSEDVSIINGVTCNASRTSGCRQRPLEAPAGAGARGIAVDESTDTVYVANTLAGTVSVIDGATCDAAVHSGCRRRAPLAPVGLSPRRIAVDESTNTIYVTNAGSDTVTMLDGRTCDARVHTGCGPVSAQHGAAPTTTIPTAPTRIHPLTAGARRAG
jgi:DNA-binding beta-propeller fold protein YncE